MGLSQSHVLWAWMFTSFSCKQSNGEYLLNIESKEFLNDKVVLYRESTIVGDFDTLEVGNLRNGKLVLCGQFDEVCWAVLSISNSFIQ